MSILTQRTSMADFDLSLADEIFSVFVGVFLAILSTKWLAGHPLAIVGIIGTAALTVVAAIVSTHQEILWKRAGLYALATGFAFACIPMLRDATFHDLPQSDFLPLPIGVAVWACIRESALQIVRATRP